jgi:cytochrome c oxidase cbb3-type subunit 3
MTSHSDTPHGNSQPSGSPSKRSGTIKPPKWCVLTLGGCWIAVVSLLAINAVSDSRQTTASTNNDDTYSCGDGPTGQTMIATIPAAPLTVSTTTTAAPDNSNTAHLAKEGKTTYNTFCVACHQAEGTGKVGFAPALRNPDFLALASDDFIRTTIKTGRPGTAMTAWAMLNDTQINGIIAYLRTTKGITQVKGKVDDKRSITGDAHAGAPLYQTYCASCHGDKGIGYLSGSSGPGIGLKGFLNTASDDYIYQTMKYGRAGTPMRPMLGATGLANLTDTDAFNIIAYLRSLNGDKAPAPTPTQTVTAGDPKIGEQQYNMNCMACHQKDGIGKPGFAPSIRNRDFLAIASDDFIRTTVSKGRPGTAMAPRPDISKENVSHIIAYLRALPNPNPVTIKVDDSLKIRGDAQAGTTKFTTYCATCHGEQGKGYITGVAGPAIGMAGFLNAASDDYIFQTVKQGRAGTAMKPFMGPEGVANLTKDDVADIISYLRSLNKQ